MTAEEFVKGFYLERQKHIDNFFNAGSNSEVAALIQSLNLDDKGVERIRQILNGSLRDTLYTILLGLDGESSIGDKQIMYKLFDEENNELTGGEIETFAYEYFQNNKFHADKGEADFIATLSFLTTEEGGRHTPVFSDYRPQIMFAFSEMQTSGFQTFIDRKIVYPGDTVEAEIRILGVEHFEGQLKENMQFDFREASKIIGTGQIKRIVNNKLRQSGR